MRSARLLNSVVPTVCGNNRVTASTRAERTKREARLKPASLVIARQATMHPTNVHVAVAVGPRFFADCTWSRASSAAVSSDWASQIRGQEC